MLSFMWVLGDMTDNSPEEIPALLADLANADEEHVNVDIEGDGGIGLSVFADRWIYISDLEGILCPPLASTPPMMRQSLRSGACWTRGG